MNKNNKAGNNNYISRFYLGNRLVTEIIEAEFFIRFLYNNFFGKIMRFFLRRAWWARLFGWYQSSPLTRRNIIPFIKKHGILIEEFEQPVQAYKSFNDFFIRKFKAGARVVDMRKHVLVSPTDAKVLVYEKITPTMQFFVKQLPFNLITFLRNPSMAQSYDQGSMMIFRLAPYDYHRYHFPISGVMVSSYFIAGLYESVNPLAYVAGVQPLLENKRHVMEIISPLYGKVLVVAVGAMSVGEIVTTAHYAKQYEKGDELGYFSFGGSSLVIITQQPVTFAPQLREHTLKGFETAVIMGQSIAMFEKELP